MADPKGPGGAGVVRPARGSDLEAVLALLESAGLPGAGVEPWLERFVVVEDDEEVVAAGGLEVYGDEGLLRSVVVDGRRRGQGLGAAVAGRLLEDARAAGLRRLYLLTTTAEAWFPRWGFAVIRREDVGRGVRSSVEFREACPASATVMALDLGHRGDTGE